jgi:2-C-methyl-D-erythritol 2,4-cyclodiphosphate synthase
VTLRVGQGVDVHGFSDDPGRPLVLAGVTLPGGPGLAGHSDADVVLHALTDALLGAAGLGDLGSVFGTEDPRHAGEASSAFLAEALRRVSEAGWTLGNADATVVAQRPRLAGHLGAMRTSAARLLGVGEELVSIKATSTDGLGFIGQGDGIACLAVVLLRQV